LNLPERKPDSRKRPIGAGGIAAWWQGARRALGFSGKGAAGGGNGVGGNGGTYTPDYRRWGLIAAAVLVVAAVIDSGVVVDATEVAVVQRFGRFNRVVGAGLQWRWPRPIESVTKINVTNVNAVSYQSLMLTSDVNLVSITAEVQYLYTDARRVLFKVRDPEGTLREVSESAIREVIGQNTLDSVLAGEPRLQITIKTRELIQKTLDSYDSGIEVRRVNLTDVQVPEDVQAAQRDYNRALEDKERLSKEAQAYANDIIPKARGTAQRVLLDAEAYKQQIVAGAEGDASRFSQLLVAYQQAPEVTRNRLYVETMEAVLARSKKVMVDGKPGGGNMYYLPLDKLLGSGGGTAAGAAPRTGTATVEPIQEVPASGSVPAAAGRSRDRIER
jgi:membrane protease subunit HflK